MLPDFLAQTPDGSPKGITSCLTTLLITAWYPSLVARGKLQHPQTSNSKQYVQLEYSNRQQLHWADSLRRLTTRVTIVVIAANDRHANSTKPDSAQTRCVYCSYVPVVMARLPEAKDSTSRLWKSAPGQGEMLHIPEMPG